MYADSEESIYNIVKEEQQKPQRAPRHISKFPGTLAPTGSTFNTAQTNRPGVSNLAGESVCIDYGGHNYGKEKGSFGRAPQMQLPDPSASFLKTKTRPVATLKQVLDTAPEKLKPSQLKEKIKPSLPDKNEKPILNLVTKKNFIVSNAVENILAAPKKVLEADEDFMNKDDFGKVPPYLNKIKKDIQAEYDYIRQLQENEQVAKQVTRPLSNEERLALLQGLKAKWEEINSEYQLATHLTKLDTVGKIARKEMHESALTQIEKDIERLKKSNIAVDQSM